MILSHLVTAQLALLATCSIICPALGQEGEKYAFLVGVQFYGKSSGLHRLRYAEQDVNDLAEEFRKAGYRTENIALLTGERAREVDPRWYPSKPNIIRELDLLLKDRETGDTIVVVLVGHGVMFKEDEESYFCPNCEEFKADALRLQVKRTPTIGATRHGFPFLGCRVYPSHLKLNRRSRARLQRRLQQLEEAYDRGKLTEQALQVRATSVLAFARAGGTKSWQVRTRVLERLMVSGHWARTG